jgi:hypothetical protein
MKKSHSVRTLIFAVSLLLQLTSICLRSHAAAGDVDLSSDPGVYRQNVARLYGDLLAPPSLTIARSNALVTISWPFSAAGFVLD